jgi:hypothetical protein
LPSSDIDNNFSLKLLLYLVLAGNTYLLVALGILAALYHFEIYNPWCSAVWHKLLIPEKVMNNFLYCAIVSFASATSPITIGFLMRNLRYIIN